MNVPTIDINADRIVQASEYRDLIIKRPWLFVAKVVLWMLMIAGGWKLAYAGPTWAAVGGVVLMALAFAHGVELQHQALHGTGTRNRPLDMILGFVLGLPLLVSVWHYRDRHMHHHRHVGTSQDSEFFGTAKQAIVGLTQTVTRMLMLVHWAMVLRLIWAAWTGGSMGTVYSAAHADRIRVDYRLFGCLLVGALVAAVWLVPLNPLVLLTLPLASCMHTLIELPEHHRCSMSPSPLENTRTVRAGWLATWFTNGNNWHVEHHLAPTLNPEELPAFHRRIADRIVHQNDSYLDLIARSFHY